uniref:Uncharacterized protein n=1 Tax=Anguilla anguilla TaxID=7936 RepID=A0A0E9VI95_ANGAN
MKFCMSNYRHDCLLQSHGNYPWIKLAFVHFASK